MDIKAFLAHLNQLNVELWDDDGYLGFDAPEEVLTPDLLEQLRQRKTEILTILRQTQADPSAPPLAPAPKDAPIPLSFSQERLWFLDQQGSQNHPYHEISTLKIEGDLNVTALEQSLTEILHRHQGLRATFPLLNGAPQQVVRPPTPFSLPLTDLRHLPADEQQAQVRQLVSREAQLPFNLAEDLLVRGGLIRLQTTSHILLLTMHHIITDNWSGAIMWGELTTLYQAINRGATPAEIQRLLPDLPLQYTDFAYWQRQWLSDQILENHLAYWQNKLADAPPLLELPTDHPRPAVQAFSGSHYPITLPPELTNHLKELSRRHGATLFMTLLAAFQILLGRYSRQNDILTGTVMANRSRPELEGLIGFFANMLVLRTNLADNPTFLELLQQVRQTTLEALQYQDLPFGKLVNRLKPDRNLSYNPLFQVAFILQNIPTDTSPLPGLTLTPVDMGGVTSKVDLTLELAETDHGLTGRFEYNTDLFNPDTMARMADHLQTLLTAIVDDPRRPIFSLPWLTPAERQQVLVDWNNTTHPYPHNRCIHHLFEEHAAATPTATAVVFENSHLTYRQLNHKANQLAHTLRAQGVGPNVLVGLYLERSPEMVIGLLAIHKAGGAYLPLDPNYPPARLSFMMSDTHTPVILTQSSLAGSLPQHSAQTICLDSDWSSIAAQPNSDPNFPVEPEHLAYVIYTSGSTGQAKGVQVAHRGLTNLALAQINVFEVQPDSRVLQFASLNFDASISEIAMALCAGASLYLAAGPDIMPGPALSRYLHKQKISHVTLVPSALAALPPEPLPHLTSLIVAGEACSPDLVKQWAPGRRFFNAYGPSEATVCATIMACHNTPYAAGHRPPPIGTAINNVQVYILDERGQPLPIGVPGELHIGGIGLAQGYLNRPELTAEKFIPNPFSKDENGRMKAEDNQTDSPLLYKTGDLARYLPDGNIEFLGRIDTQVKLRGYRIELGEIEAVLSQHPQVQEAAVIVREDSPGTKRLAAYLVPAFGETPPDLREHLKQSLPDYMIPNVFVPLETMPLNPNGKVDRRALPHPELVNLDQADFSPPTTPNEKILAEIWSALLGVTDIDIYDSFFELGGDSILSIQMINKAKDTGLHLTNTDIFEYQTLTELAAIARSIAPAAAPQQAVTGTAPLTPIQHWFFEQALPNPHHFNQAVLLTTAPALQIDALQAALDYLAEQHDALRLRFEMVDNSWQQEHHAASKSPALTVINLAEMPPSDQTKAIESHTAELQSSLNLNAGPLLRADLFNMGDDLPGRLLLVAHHLLVDAVSWQILLADLQTAYQQRQQGQAVELPAKSSAFKDWALHLSKYAQTEAVTAQLDYWANRDTPSLPLDNPGGSNRTADAAVIPVSLSPAQTDALLHQAPKAYNTHINDLLLTALAQTLSQWSGESTVHLNLEGHGRLDEFETVDLSRTVGWFTTLYPLTLTLPDAGPGPALKAIKEQLRRVPQQGVGYGLLRYLTHQPDLSLLPYAPVSFNYFGQLDQLAPAGPLFTGRATEAIGPLHDPQGQRPALLEINGFVLAGQLRFEWSYSPNIHQAATIRRVATEFMTNLKRLIEHCLTVQTPGYTPADFPLAGLTQTELDDIITTLAADGQANNIEAIYPFSPLQKGLLFHLMYEADSAAYRVQMALTLRGLLDVAAFKQAWQTVVARHPTLRTLFLWQNRAEPLQVVCRQVSPVWTELDWRKNDDNLDARLQAHLTSEIHQPLNLEQPPVMRFCLVRTADDCYHFIWTLHHIMLDGWSGPLVFKDVFTVYQGLVANDPVTLPPAPRYQSYIVWLQQQDMAQAEAYWRDTLADFTIPTPLVVDKPADSDGNPVSHLWQLPKSLTAALSELARQNQLTLNTLLQGAWAILLSRYSGADDVLFGSVDSGRTADLPGIQTMVGLLLNTLPTRVQIPADSPLIPWLKELQSRQAKQRQYAYTPLSDIQRWSDIPGGTSLFESVFTFENYPLDGATTLENLQIEVLNAFDPAHYPLMIDAIPGDALTLVFTWQANRFEAAAIERMAGHLQTILTGFIAQPDTPLKQLPLLTEAEQQQLLVEWNDTATDYRLDVCYTDLFDVQAQRSPDAIAITYNEQALTYRQVQQQTTHLARQLVAQGVTREQVVPILAERTPDFLIAIIAIFKAGGVYLPLDPRHPPQRLAHVLRQTNAPLLLTDAAFEATLAETLSLLPSEPPRTMARLSDLLAQPANPAIPLPALSPDDLAYVIFTSGSTGLPKGALLEHKGFLNHLYVLIDALNLTAEDVIVQNAAQGFDISVWQFLTALMIGAQTRIVPDDVAHDSRRLIDLLQAQPITIFEVVPSLLRVMLAEIERRSPAPTFPHLRWLIPTGEALPPDLCRQWFDHFPHIPMINAYGPAECSDDVTLYALREAPGPEVANIPIGQPVGNMQLYLLDDRLQPLPQGCSGEIYIGGVGVGRGYLNDAERTAAAFLPNPFGPGRLYKTGDVGRFIVDHHGRLVLEFLGRVDHQVKVRGFRIELGEIETVLSRHPQVKEVVAAAREDQPGQKQLVAYFTLNTLAKTDSSPLWGEAGRGAESLIPELRDFAKQKLPDYMIPAWFMPLDALPLTPNGKLDRRALPAPDATGLAQKSFAPPRNAIEKTLAQVWVKVLNVPQVGIYDDFFALGGDSILSMQIVNQARQAGLSVSVKQVFERLTVAALAEVASPLETVVAEQGLVTGPVPLSPIQRWFFAEQLPEPHHYNQAFMLQLPADVSAPHLEQALRHLLRHHDALRMRFTQQGGSWQQVNSAEWETLALQVFDLADAPPDEQQTRLDSHAAELQASLNLSAGPLVRAALFTLGKAQPARLFIIIHHLVVDGVSWRILLDDLTTAYHQLQRGEAVRLPAKSSAFKAWANQLVEYARTETLLAESDYWSQTAAPSIPRDNPAGQNSVASEDVVVVSLSQAETNALLQDVPQAYHTQINDVLLTALAQGFNHWSGHNELLIHLEGHGREELFETVDVSRTVGWFTSLFPVRLSLPDKNPGPGPALKAIKEQLRGIPNRGIGYGILRYLSPNPTLPPAAPLEVGFNYMGQFDQFITGDLFLGLIKEAVGGSYSAKGPRSVLLDINGVILDGRLQFSFAYSKNVHHTQTIEQVAGHFITALQELINHCLLPDSGGYTPSDFPLTHLSQTELDALLARLQANGVAHVESIYPLSPMQQGLLFHTLYEPDEMAYRVQTALTLDGKVDVSALKQAWQAVIQRHPMLHTLFLWEGYADALQVVCREVPFPWFELDWQGQPDLDSRLSAYLQEDLARELNFEEAPIMRFSLIKVAPQRYHFVWTSHHILLDGWSTPVIIKDVLVYYQALTAGKTPADVTVLPPAPRYQDYMVWLQQQDMAQAEAFWRQTLQGFTAPTPLAVDREREDESGHGIYTCRLSKSVTATLSQLAQQHQLTLNTLIQGAFALLLGRYNNSDDVLFGSVDSGRSAPVPNLEEMAGLLINTLPSRVHIPAKTLVLDWLKSLQAQQLKEREFAFAPLVDIQRWSEVPGNLPLFDTAVAFENYPLSATEVGQNEFVMTPIAIHDPTHYALTLDARPGDEFTLTLTYQKDRFDADTIARMGGHLQTILTGFTTHLHQPVQHVPLLTEAERQQLLVEWNDSAADVPHHLNFTQLFEAQVERTPQAAAVSFGGQTLTYQQLNQQADHLARVLVGLGVKPEVLVPVLADRGIDFLLAILAVFKAGGAYLPLDPRHPPQRLAQVLKQVDCPLVLTNQAYHATLLETLPLLPNTHQPALHRLSEVMAQQPTHTGVLPTAGPDNLAYIIFTSGSTGLPKGAMVEQKGMINHLYAKIIDLNLTGADIILQNASQCFDISVWQFLAALLVGGRTHIVSDDIAHDPTLLYQVLDEEAVTIFETVPSLLKAMLTYIAEIEALRPFAHLRWLVPTGEALPPELCREWFTHYPNIPMINAYGPTECSDDVTHYVISQPPEEGVTNIPIGNPVVNMRLYILDEQLEPVPAGCVGQLYVGGIGVGRGYINDAERTRQAFIADPFSDDPNARLYRTGDLGRYLDQGGDRPVIEFLGRIDFQVKIRGFRIELGEIEAALLQHPQVHQTVVVAATDHRNQKQLAAYFVPDNQALEIDPPANAALPHDPSSLLPELRDFLKQKLPEYMIPAYFMPLDVLPLTSNGKINRLALPAPDQSAMEQKIFIAPRTATEKELAAIWGKVLEIDSTKIGRDDNFFELGGHSLLATQVLSQLRKAFQQGLPLRSIFENPTIADLAKFIDTIHSLTSDKTNSLDDDDDIVEVQL